MNNSIFREEWEKLKGVENIINISVLIGYKQGLVMSVPILFKSKKIYRHIFSIFINSFGVFKQLDSFLQKP